MYCKLTDNQVNSFIQEYGSPLYVFHSDEFENNYENLLNSMRSIYHKYNIAYSYKTNYTPRICELVKSNGGLAEVVSDMEYKLAKRIGYTSKSIIYNGPVKGKGLFEHLSEGGTANIDSLDELRTVIEFANNNKTRKIKLAFRVNIDIGQGFVSRFGIEADVSDTNRDLNVAFNLCNACENIEVVGIHCHIGKSRSIEAWENRINRIFDIVDRYFKKPPEFIDLGSGMNSIMEPELAIQFGEHIPSFKEYASVIATAMNSKYGLLSEKEQPWLYTEPGTTLVSGCMSFLGTIISIKTVKNKDYVTFDCSGGNIGDISHLKNLPISVYHQEKNKKVVNDASFVGYTCLEHDHIYEGYTGELAVGDIVQFRNIGSYSNVFKPPFILPNCAMIEFNGKDTRIIKQSESFDDIFHTYLFER